MKNDFSLRNVKQGGMRRFSALLFSLVIAAVTCLASAQTKSVTGTVVDETGEPVIGANVAVKGTTLGTVTDINGDFALTDIPSKAVLAISYVGYTTQEVSVEGKSVINVTLQENRELLISVH